MFGLFYDTETSDMPLWSKPSNDEGQPHIVQLAAKLVNLENFTEEAGFVLIANAEGWEISEEAGRVHGITVDRARAIGLPEVFLIHALWSLWEISDIRIGHNEPFDARMVRIALKRYFDEAGAPGFMPGEVPADMWKAGQAACTARLSTKIVDLPPTPKMVAAGRHHAKTPNLGEAYEFFTGKSLEGAHDAMVDVDATIAIWRALSEAGHINPAEIIGSLKPTPPAAAKATDDDVPSFLG